MRSRARSGMSGQLEPEGRAAAVAVLETDASLHHLDQALANGEPEPCAALVAGGGRVSLAEAGENAYPERLRDARSAVMHRNAQPRAARLSGDLHRLAFGRKLGRVREEVGHHLEEALAVGIDLATDELTLRFEAHLEAIAEALVQHHRLVHQIVDAEHLRVERQLA